MSIAVERIERRHKASEKPRHPNVSKTRREQLDNKRGWGNKKKKGKKKKRKEKKAENE
jgi:hypothetical protein